MQMEVITAITLLPSASFPFSPSSLFIMGCRTLCLLCLTSSFQRVPELSSASAISFTQ
jgi:hypothetical protein